MGVTANMVLAELEPFRDEWIMIHPDQTVKDIIAEVLDAHEENAIDYDSIAPFFNDHNVDDVCMDLYNFCKQNIRYREESEKVQTTKKPVCVLTQGFGDCKHYASFCGGVLDALNRLYGRKIKWCYRFASYKILQPTPYHVFVVVYNNGSEIWIDPTPGADSETPVWQIDKKIKAQTMALYRNIGTVDAKKILLANANGAKASAIGKSSLTLTPSTTPFDGYYNHKFPNAPGMNPFLGLSQYRDEGGDRNLNTDQVAQQLNTMIASGPAPGHAVDGAFVQWVYDENLRSWNFYYPMGVAPGFSAELLLPASYPHLIITGDGRLTFDKDVKIDDYRNDEIHMLTAWAQSLINDNDPEPYPVKPLHLKEFSQLKYGNVDQRNLFTERRGTSIFQDVGKALEHTINFIKEGVLEVVGFIPRNAFLGLVGINAFNFAGNLWENIQGGNWDKMAKIWENLGGKADKFRNTIEDGKDKKAILGSTSNGNTIGVIDVAALLASAAPIMAALLAFLDKNGKAGEVLDATKGFLQTAYPGLDLTAFGFLDKKTGQTLTFTGSPQYNENLGAYNPGMLPPSTSGGMSMLTNNPIPVAAGAGIVTYLLTNKKGRKPNYIMPVIVAGGIYLLITKMMGSSAASGGLSKKQAVINYYAAALSKATTSSDKAEIQTVMNACNAMSDSEINIMYQWLTAYVQLGKQVPETDPLYMQIVNLNTKYHFLGS